MEQSTIICPHCQTTNPARNLYCQSCGKPLVQAAPVPAQAPTPEGMPTSQPVTPQPPDVQSPAAPGFPPAAQPGSMPPYPDQGMPPQMGYAPQGVPPQNYPPQPPQGYPQQGLPQQGLPQQGLPHQPQVYPPQGMPPQQGYYPPPPPAPKPPAPPALEQLGVRVDGWSDLVPGAGDQAEAIQKDFMDGFNAREIPNARLEPANFTNGGFQKTYWVVRASGESTAVQIEPKGKDLFVGWSQYEKRTWDLQKIGILMGAAVIVSFLANLGSLVGSFGYFLLGWIFGTFNWLLPVTIIALVAGYVWKGSFWYFFMPEANEMTKDDRTALMLAVHQSLLDAVQKAGFESDALRDNGFWVSSRDRKI